MIDAIVSLAVSAVFDPRFWMAISIASIACLIGVAVFGMPF
jgi:hypothetical protein